MREVAAMLPKDRYMEFFVADKRPDAQKWEQLCTFLEVAECSPLKEGTPFPNSNDRIAMQVVGHVAGIITWVWPIVPLLPVLILLALCSCLCKKRAAKTKEQ